MTIKFTPHPGFLLIEPTEKNSSHFDSAQKDNYQPSTGVVVAIGIEMYHQSGEILGSGVEAGDEIVFQAHVSDKLKLDGKDYLITPFSAVRGKLG